MERDCVTGEPRQAITNCRSEEKRLANRGTTPRNEPPRVDQYNRRIYGFVELYWPWIAIAVAIVIGWGARSGLVAGLASLAALIGFAIWSPNPCRAREPSYLGARCPNWGHGVFRGCSENHDHRRIRNDAWIGVLARRSDADTQIWRSRQGIGTVVGFAVAR